MDEVSTSTDHQSFLAAAVQNRNIYRFRLALLLNGANPDMPEIGAVEGELTIFERCCLTPGYHEFVRECIRWGCNVNRRNKLTGKRAINYATESGDFENVRAVLEGPIRKSPDPMRAETESLSSADSSSSSAEEENFALSPLNHLAQNINSENFEELFKCMKELIDRHANPNVPDQSRSTPILIIAKSNIPSEKKERVIKYFLDNSSVDIDSYRDGETRLFLKSQFPHLPLPDQRRVWDFHLLMEALRHGTEEEFLDGFGKFELLTDDVSVVFRQRLFNETLLMVSARRGFVQAAKKLLVTGADVNNYQTQKTASQMLSDKFCDLSRLPIELACQHGNWEVLDLLLKQPNIHLGNAPLLVIVVKNIEPGLNCGYRKCFFLLLSFPKIDVNQSDTTGCTALHAAVRNNNHAVILALLNKGAYIGSPNNLNDLPITDIDAKVLETHLNSCISTNGRRSGDDNYKIRFDFTNLVPLIVRKEQQNAWDSAQVSQCTDEMAPIEYMTKSPELKHLVKHPLIASFLFLKWHQLALVFYANFICYTIYCLAIILYVLLCYGKSDANVGMSTLLYLISLLGSMYVFVREIGQLVMSPRVYFRNNENYLELVLITTTVIILANFDFSESTRKTVASFTILLSVTEFFLLTGSLPVLSFSTHLVMLKTVAKSFMKGLLLYSIILIAFGLCFYTLLGDVRKDVNAVADEISDFNNFVHPGAAIAKAVVMLTGEFDASNIHFKQNYASYVLFVIFVLLISTVLSNLLNGLAVSDTQAIKNEAELMNFIYRAKLMARYEKILLGKGENGCINFLLQKWSSSMMKVFPEFLPMNMITVLPNSNNKVVIPLATADERFVQSNPQSIEDGNVRQLEGKVRALNCCIGIRCSRMEMKIVKYAKHVLDIKDRDLKEHKERETMQQRIINIEHLINDMSGKVEVVAERLALATQ